MLIPLLAIPPAPASPPANPPGGLAYALDTLVRIWRFELMTIEGNPLTVGSLIIFVAVLILGAWLARLLSRAVSSGLVRRFHVNEGPAATIRALLFYLLLAVVFVFSLQIINVPLTIFAVAGGALAIGIGFGSQNVVNNFISGLILLVERPVRVGDIIEVDGLQGIVREIGPRSTRVVTGDNVDVVIPNSAILQANIVNWTLGDDTIRAGVSVGVVYGSPVREVETTLLDAAAAHERILREPPPVVLFEDFGDNALLFRLYFWVRIRRPFERRRVESDLRFDIDDRLRAKGITIAFPQRDVHLDTLKPLDVRLLHPDTPARKP